MKRKALFYSVFGLILAGSFVVATAGTTPVADAVTISSSDNSSELNAVAKREKPVKEIIREDQLITEED